MLVCQKIESPVTSHSIWEKGHSFLCLCTQSLQVVCGLGGSLLATRTEQSKKPNGAPKKYPKTNNCQPAILILLPFTVAAKVVVTNFHSRRRTNQKTVNDLCTCFVYTILTPNYGDSVCISMKFLHRLISFTP